MQEKMDSRCAVCANTYCRKNQKNPNSPICPMEDEELYEKAKEIVLSEDYNEFFINSSKVEKIGYNRFPRIKEIMVFIKMMGYKRVGLVFCGGLMNEARIVDRIFRENGINLISAMCKTGGCDKCQVGLKEEEKLRPGEFEPMCNPVAQALILNKEKTEFNIVMGLCVGHDSLFYKFSDSLVTTLIVKDRNTGHNPVAAIYGADGYFKDRIKVSESDLEIKKD